MRFLLDTHAFIWFTNGDKQLSEKAREVIEPIERSEVFFSVASLWEIAIKVNVGKLFLNKEYSTIISELQINNFELLPIKFEHTLIVSSLPLHHRDPFDRILIAQAQEENLTIITKDKNFSLYKNIKLLW